MIALILNHSALRSLVLLLIAAFLDWLVGDPWSWPHPVQAIGAWIRWWCDRLLPQAEPLPTGTAEIPIGSINQAGHPPTGTPQPTRPEIIRQRCLGVALMLSTILGSALVVWVLVVLAAQVNPWLGLAIESIILAACLAGRSLRDAAIDVLKPLADHDLAEARSRLSRYVGRDTDQLTEPDILRAVLETVAENGIDGVLAPWWWAIGAAIVTGLIPISIGPANPASNPSLGAMTGLVAAVAIAYKAASTLDSMVGYREPPYTHIGWASARTEDGLTWLACRCAVGSIGLLSGQPGRVWSLCRRDAIADPSPNSGWSECAYAAALGVQLGGPNTYRGQLKLKPLLGDPNQAISPTIIHQALRLTRHVFLTWLICTSILLFIMK